MTKSIEAARAAVDSISQWWLFVTGTHGQSRAQGPLVLNPMFGILWSIIGRVLIAASEGGGFGRRTEITASLRRLVETMEAFGGWSPVIGEFCSLTIWGYDGLLRLPPCLISI